ncbi:MAG: esterase, partial [Acidobacteria bacterium]
MSAMRKLLSVGIILLSWLSVSAQVANEGRPATSNVRGAEYPKIRPDLRVTFQIKAPTAEK